MTQKSKQTRPSWEFYVIWFGQVISIVGSGLTGFALSVWIYQQTDSVTTLSLLFFLSTAPGLLLSPFLGVLIDRLDRRWILVLSDTGSALGTLTFALLFFTNRLAIWHIALVVIVTSVLASLQRPAYLASVTLLVPREAFGRANGLIQLGQALSVVVSPLLAGFLLETIGLTGIFLVDFGTFLFAIAALIAVRIPKPPATAEGKTSRGSLLRQTVYGWNYLKGRAGLWALSLFLLTINFTFAMGNLLITPLVLSAASATRLGILLSIYGIGLLAGSLVMSAWGGTSRRMNSVLGGTCLMAVALMISGATTLAVPVAAGLFFLAFSFPVVSSSVRAILQSKVAPDVQGRVFATLQMISGVAAPLSYVLAGPLSDNVFEPLMAVDGPLADSVGRIMGIGTGRGIGLLFVVLGVLTLAALLVAHLYPRLRLVEDELPDSAPIALQPSKA
jgi:DHA3 family macrolide efflux protein-like MFS transporter